MFLAADKLRQNLEPSDYKHVVLGLVFLKHVSVAFEAKHAELLAEDPEAAEDPDEYMADRVFWVPQEGRCHRRPSILRRRPQGDRQCRSPGGWPLAQQQGREFTPAVSATRARDGAISQDEDAPEIRCGPRHGPQPLQSGTPPH